MGRRLVFGILLVVVVAGCKCTGDGMRAEVSPQNLADGYYLRGMHAFREGQFDEALRAYEDVERVVPGDPRLPAARGEVFLAQGRLGDALAHFQEAASRQPERQLNWARLGSIQRILGNPDAARPALEKALQLSPRDWSSREELGELVAATDVPKGVDVLLQAAKDAPAEGHVRIMKTLANLLEKNGSLDTLKHLAEEEPKDSKARGELFARLGGLYLSKGELDLAADAYGSATQASPGDATSWELLGELEVKRNRLAEADAAFVKALEQQDRSTVHIARLRLFLKDGKRVEALRELDRALAAATSQDIRESEEIADGLFLVGRGKEALQILSTLAEDTSSKTNWDLQLHLANVAKYLKDAATLSVACERLRRGDAGIPKNLCP